MATESHDRQSDLAVMDANEYKQKRRLRRILDAHEKVEDRADEAYDLYATGQISADAKNIILLRAVREFVRETYNLLLDYHANGETGEEESTADYLNGQELGVLELEHNEDIRFVGLSDLLHCRKIYQEEWTESVASRHGPGETETHTRTHTVPEDVIWRGYLVCRRFLAREHDLELQFEELDDSRPFEDWGEDHDGF